MGNQGNYPRTSACISGATWPKKRHASAAVLRRRWGQPNQQGRIVSLLSPPLYLIECFHKRLIQKSWLDVRIATHTYTYIYIYKYCIVWYGDWGLTIYSWHSGVIIPYLIFELSDNKVLTWYHSCIQERHAPPRKLTIQLLSGMIFQEESTVPVFVHGTIKVKVLCWRSWDYKHIRAPKT